MALTNGDFETGDLDGGWIDNSYADGDATATAAVTTGAKRNGTYGCSLYAECADEYSWATPKIYFLQQAWENISFWYKVNAKTGDNAFLRVVVQSANTETTLFQEEITATTGWKYCTRSRADAIAELDPGDYLTGGSHMNILISAMYVTTEVEVFIDDVQIVYADSIKNGNFEKYNEFFLPNWEEITYTDDTADVEIIDTADHSGTYGLKLTGSVSSESDVTIPGVQQPIPVDFTTISFWYKVNALTLGTGSAYLRIQMSTTESNFASVWYQELTTTTSWTQITINKSEIDLDGDSWDLSTLFSIVAGGEAGSSGTTSFEVFVDDIVVSRETGLENGDFEMGDLSRWSSEATGTYESAISEVIVGAVENGTYGCNLYLETEDANTATVAIYRDIPTYFDRFAIDYKVMTSSGGGDFTVYVQVHNSSHVPTWVAVAGIELSSTSGWTSLEVVKNECDLGTGHWAETGMTGIKFEVSHPASGSGTKINQVYLDDLTVNPTTWELVNGDFETGDLTGWTNDTTGSGTHSGTQTVTLGAAYSDNFGARLTASAVSEGAAYSNIYTTLPVGDWQFLKFFVKANNLVTDFIGYNELQVYVQMMDDVTPTWVLIKTMQANQFAEWRPILILFDEIDFLRSHNSYDWIDSEIPLRIALYHYNEDSSTHDCEVFIDDVTIETIGEYSNGGFEMNSLTEWINDSYVKQNPDDTIPGEVEVDSSNTDKHAGSYAAQLDATFYDPATVGETWTSIMRPLVVADFTSISFWYRITDATGGVPKFNVYFYASLPDYAYCDWVQIFELVDETFVEGDWIHVSATKTEIIDILESGEAEFMDTSIMKFSMRHEYNPS